ncbi:MAG TPA: class E sortase [Actinomycetota bacterium]|nr:class E sortase [Actinomycetota bacterium]
MVLRAVGRTFIALGVLILMFLGYQLWGTNLVAKQHQSALAADLQPVLDEPSPSASPSPIDRRPDPGSGIAVIRIPKISVDSVVVEGVSVEDLKKGPGHVRGMALPGEKGNVVISGHRTTYGAPFYRLDEVKVGDEIKLFDRSGEYTYIVTETRIVSPDDQTIVVPSTDARLTLTTCHPRYSAKKRLIVFAALQGEPKAAAA